MVVVVVSVVTLKLGFFVGSGPAEFEALVGVAGRVVGVVGVRDTSGFLLEVVVDVGGDE